VAVQISPRTIQLIWTELASHCFHNKLTTTTTKPFSPKQVGYPKDGTHMSKKKNRDKNKGKKGGKRKCNKKTQTEKGGKCNKKLNHKGK
jgi:hypothetical protein